MRRDGFTLIELMITSAILLLVMLYVTQAFTVQQKTYVVVDQVTEAQQNLRAVSDLIDRDVRLAGYMVPRQAAICGHDATTGPDRLYPEQRGRDPFGVRAGGRERGPARTLRGAGIGRHRRPGPEAARRHPSC